MNFDRIDLHTPCVDPAQLPTRSHSTRKDCFVSGAEYTLTLAGPFVRIDALERGTHVLVPLTEVASAVAVPTVTADKALMTAPAESKKGGKR